MDGRGTRRVGSAAQAYWFVGSEHQAEVLSRLGGSLKSVVGFTNSEEEGVRLTKVVLSLVEDELKVKGADWSLYVVSDGLLITRQNPASSGPAAQPLLQALAV